MARFNVGKTMINHPCADGWYPVMSRNDFRGPISRHLLFLFSLEWWHFGCFTLIAYLTIPKSTNTNCPCNHTPLLICRVLTSRWLPTELNTHILHILYDHSSDIANGFGRYSLDTWHQSSSALRRSVVTIVLALPCKPEMIGVLSFTQVYPHVFQSFPKCITMISHRHPIDGIIHPIRVI